MLLTYLMLAVALSLSAVAAYYSIAGLTAIFAAAVVPIVIMGSMLELAKLVVTVWLHEYWHRVKLTMRCYLVPAVAVLMLITSMGIFGFLSKAHLDQSVPAGDIAAELQIFDDKIKTQRDNIDTARRALQQMDAQVDQMLGRTQDDRGAERAVQIRRQQAKERSALQNEIARSQKIIVDLQTQRAPKAAEVRKVEAEVGPIKYIAALIYGDNPDANLLEKAVRWVIILLVGVFDPLAIMMLLAATESWRWEQQRRQQPAIVDLPTSVADTPVHEHQESAAVIEPEPDTVLAETPSPAAETQPVSQSQDEPAIKRAMKLWKQLNPTQTLKEQRQKFTQGLINRLPWLDLVADNEPPSTYNQNGFGNVFPMHAVKGDTYVRVDTMPHRLYKYNGSNWIEVQKETNTAYAFDTAYIDHLIEKLQSGELDPELLTETETEEIAKRVGPSTT